MSTRSDYPLCEKQPDRLKTLSGIGFREIVLSAMTDGRIRMEDLRVTREALEMQAQIAESVGRMQLAENLLRAAELVNVPDREILEIYSALRPGRADRSDLCRKAERLELRYSAYRCAALLREAAQAYG